MALPSSGSISLNQVNVELGNSGTATINMGSSAVRGLFEVSSGAIGMSNGHGKSNVSYMSATGGTVTTDGDYKIHTFTGSGAFVVSDTGNQGTDVTFALAGGGGGGGGQSKYYVEHESAYYWVTTVGYSGASSTVSLNSSTLYTASGGSGGGNSSYSRRTTASTVQQSQGHSPYGGTNGGSHSANGISGTGGTGQTNGYGNPGTAPSGSGYASGGAGSYNHNFWYAVENNRYWNSGGGAGGDATGTRTPNVETYNIVVGGGGSGGGSNPGTSGSAIRRSGGTGGNGSSGLVKITYKFQN